MLTNAQLNNILREVVTILRADYEPEEVILFGSYAYGSPHRDSDLDLFIVKESADRPLQLMNQSLLNMAPFVCA